MIKEFCFRWDELGINPKKINSLLGYGDGPLPEPFDEYLQLALYEAANLTDIRSAYKIIDDVQIDSGRGELLAGKIRFIIGKTICNELKGVQRVAFFVSTAGITISEKPSDLLPGNDPVLGYVYDILGSIIAESATDRMQLFVKKEAELNSDLITNRYSPGYCQWHVSEQHKLFSLIQENTCGVTLADSALMHPIKSISGIIGIGKGVKFREYECTLCTSKDCIYRKIKSGFKMNEE